jgi:quinol monooxygenase YgiN
MTTLFVRHKVKDYANWKREYDAFDATRKNYGVRSESVYRDTDDPSTVIVTHTFKDTSKAKAFANSKDLKSAMEKAGVAGHPEIWFGENN